MPERTFDDRATIAHDITKIILAAFQTVDDDPAVVMSILTLVNAHVLNFMLEGDNPTKLLEGLVEHVEQEYANIQVKDGLND
jgi:hypothetical protein